MATSLKKKPRKKRSDAGKKRGGAGGAGGGDGSANNSTDKGKGAGGGRLSSSSSSGRLNGLLFVYFFHYCQSPVQTNYEVMISYSVLTESRPIELRMPQLGHP